MALVRTLEKGSNERTKIHREVECTYTVFTDGGRKVLQIDTYGTPERRVAGTVSQILQFDRESALALKAIIERAFG